MTASLVLDGNGVAHVLGFSDVRGRFACCGLDITAATTLPADHPAWRCTGCFV